MENFNCPQFVDFTSPEAFELNDGADYFFEKGVVGQIDLGLDNDMFKQTNRVQEEEDEEEEDKVQALVDQLKNSNFNTKTKIPFANSSNNNVLPTEIEQSAKKTEEKTPTLPECVAQYKTNKLNKENQAVLITASNNNKPKMVTSQNSDSCNTTFSIKTPTATKPSEDTNNLTTPNMNIVTKLSMNKQDSIENNNNSANSIKYQTPIANGQPVSHIPKHVNSTPTPHITVENKKSTILTNSGSNQPNIVKKTLAKMTAAFKQRNNTNSNDNLIFKVNKSDTKKQKPTNEPLRVENHIKRKNSNEMFRNNKIMSPESDNGNRRASSVPRTLREKQALSKAGIVVLENIEDNKPKNVTKDDTATKVKQSDVKILKPKAAPPTSIITLASAKKKQLNKQQTLEERRRSRSCNESISNLRTNRHVRRSTNEESIDPSQSKTATTETTKTKISASPLTNQLKPRAKSGERAPLMPMYSGVKFVPRIPPHKYSNLDGANFTQSNQHATSVLSTLPLEDVLKQRPVCMQKRSAPMIASSKIKIDMSKQTTLLANRSLHNSTKSASFKCKVNSTNTSIVNPKPASNISLVKPSTSDYHLNSTQNSNNNNNISISSSSALDSSRMRKKPDKQVSNSFLHTELRALKRQEYDQSMKEKEKMAIQMKQDLDSERLKKEQEEIQKIRMQRTFRPQPIKHYKPIEIKHSEKPLTDPKSPNLTVNHHQNSKLGNMSATSKNISFNALVDVPLTTNKSATNSNLFRSNSLLRNQESTKQRNLAVSHDDIRFGN